MARTNGNGVKLLRRQVLQRAAIAGAAGPALFAEPAGAQAQAGLRKGGTLTMMITPEPPLLILGVNNQGPTLIVGSKIYEGLLTFSAKLDARPGLAKSWSVSPDGLTYVFNLQSGVTWHDGKPFSADDAVFSIMKFHMEVSPRSRAIFQRIDSCVAGDANTLVIKLKAPFEPFLLMFDSTTCAIVPKHIYDGTDYRNNPANQTPIGTGPFRFGEWQRGNFIKLVRHDKYWKPNLPVLDELIYRVIPDSNLRGVSLQTGQVQVASFNDIEAFDVPRFRAEPNLNVDITGWELFSPLSWLDINHRVKPLDDVRVRRALAMAIDRNFILNRIWFGVGKPATGPISSTTRFYDPSVKLPAFDVKAAAALLDEAGLKPKADGTRLELKFMSLPYGEIWTRLGEYIRQAFSQIGVKLTAEAVDAGAWVRKLANWEYDLTINFVYQWGDPTLGVERTYVSTNIQKIAFTNTMGYVNPRVDDLFKIARESSDSAMRQRALSDVQKLLIEDMPVVWLLELAFPTIHEKRVRNLITSGTGIHAPFDDVGFAT